VPPAGHVEKGATSVEDLDLLVDLHLDGRRQGPGSGEATRRAIALSGLDGREALTIADLGCGTGASTLVLADALDACIAAVDIFPAFLRRLDDDAERRGVADLITTVAASLDALPFADETLDAIWSEGAIYNIGFERGLGLWRRSLKPGAVIAVSELTWLTRPLRGCHRGGDGRGPRDRPLRALLGPRRLRLLPGQSNGVVSLGRNDSEATTESRAPLWPFT
jgi:SAM-dependent methyltransferase